MSVRPRRALGALAAAALSCISVIGLQATAASAAEMRCYLGSVLVDCNTGKPIEVPPRDPHGRSAPASEEGAMNTVADGPLQPREYDSTVGPRRTPWEVDATKPVPGNDHSNPFASVYADVQLAAESERPVVEHPPVRVETAAAAGRPVTENPMPKPIWCTDVETGEVFQCGWQS